MGDHELNAHKSYENKGLEPEITVPDVEIQNGTTKQNGENKKINKNNER